MKLQSYNILFRIFSYLADKTNGSPFFVKYKLMLGTMIIGLGGASAQAQTVDAVNDTIQPSKPDRELITCYKPAVPIRELNNISNELIEIKGKVQEENKEPIIGVGILVEGTNNGTVTDIDGKFSIKVKPSDKLIFSFVGMDKKVIQASNLQGGEAIITMKESNLILCYEVVIVRYDYPDDIYRRKPNLPTKLSYETIEQTPVSEVGDIHEFEQWVERNIQYSDQMRKDKTKGDVILSFAIDKRGKLVDAKVVGKLSKEADAEALRVLKSSPNWKPGTNLGKAIKTTMTISVHFDAK